MPELPWFDDYDGQTTEQLLALEGKYRTDSLIVALDQALQQKEVRAGGEALSDEERVILAVVALENEVNNGGYAQFFVNSSNEYAPVIVQALRGIGCPKIAETARKALEIVQQDPITEDEIENGNWAENEKRQSALEQCDALFLEYPENIEASLFAFIKANRAKIAP